MPTILRADGFTVKIHGPPREHGPPHVHVERGGAELAVIRLPWRGRGQRLWRVHGMSDAHVVRAFRLVERHEGLLLRAWERIHGTTPTR
jgi:hypothetical protein